MPEREIRTAFVTGGTGFIGSHLVEVLLRKGVQVKCLLRRPLRGTWLDGLPVKVVPGGLEDGDALREGCEGADAVFHLAGLTAAPSRRDYLRVNAEGSRGLGQAVMACRIRPGVLVYASSLAVAGPSGAHAGVCEEDDPAPLTDYGRSKLEGERILAGMEGVPLVTVRPPAVYGPRDPELLPFFRLAAWGLVPVVNRGARLSLIHVADLAQGMVRAARAGTLGQIYYLAHPQAVPGADLPRLFAKALGKSRMLAVPVPRWALWGAAALAEAGGRFLGKVPVFNRQKVSELAAPGWVCRTDKARAHLGFEARIGAPEGFQETARWYREHGWL